MPLFIVATPIGNLKDITLRALETLSAADLIACEDTRQTRKLLTHYRIHKPTVSLHEHNEVRRIPELMERMGRGLSIALVSDAGTPLISDPGAELVRAAISGGIPVIPIPGPSALTAAVSAAGLASNVFFFVGFLPPKRKARQDRLRVLAALEAPLVIYEGPHRIRETLRDVLEVLGDRQVCLGRELTKLHEEFLRGRLSEVSAHLAKTTPRGEFVMIVEPGGTVEAGFRSSPSSADLHEEISALMRERGLDLRTAASQVASLHHISKNALYRAFVKSRTDRS
ncbi:MAG: 16S rRNA (cytidine(1402)-2'-O)-methyltransferase [Acidobacteria bacterium]|nr:16S rRNA (cytidine(1402)-2'-O)-methyltransferase [Acidobacteriota bacterium]